MIVENEISSVYGIYNVHDDVKFFVYLQYLFSMITKFCTQKFNFEIYAKAV